MKKVVAYLGFGLLSLTAILIIGTAVVVFMINKIDGANARLEVREAERSALEDGWLSAHGSDKVVTLHIENIELKGSSGRLEWFESEGSKGTVHFSIEEGTISLLESISDLPENVTSYPLYFRQAIETEMN